jgi:hypothetical protein
MKTVLRTGSRNGGSGAVRIFRAVTKAIIKRKTGMSARLANFHLSRLRVAVFMEDSPEDPNTSTAWGGGGAPNATFHGVSPDQLNKFTSMRSGINMWFR